MTMANERGIKTKLMRLKTAWPFPEERVRELSRSAKGFVVPEVNLGQMVREVERCAVDECTVLSLPHAGGDIHRPEQILDAIVQTQEGKVVSRLDLAGGGI